ncbi:reverse transcriptase domain-containing protein [Tanacetum coccineum]
MRTRSQSRNSNRQQQVNPTFVEPFNLVEPIENQAPPVVTMADNRTMAQLLEAPTEGYEDAIVVPEITADNFELKHGLLTLVQNKQFFGHDKEDPHAHIRYFNKITSTMKFSNVPSSGTLPSNTITNPKEDLKGITTRSGVAYQGPTIPTTSSSPPKVVERETEVTKDTVPPTNNGSTEDVQPPVVQVQSQVPNSEPVVAPVNLNFDISFADALILMPKFASTLKSLISNKEKLFELARTLLNEHCSAVLLKKLPEKLGDPSKFLIPFDFPEMDECLALADLGASINLMPLSVWKKLSLSELTPTCMTLELANRSISQPIGIAKYVYVKEGELTLRVGKEAVTFNIDQTLRYSSKYDDNSVNRIDVIDMACEEYSQEVLGFFDVIASGNPTPYYDPIVSTSSSTITPFGDSDFLLEEVDAFLALEDDPTS